MLPIGNSNNILERYEIVLVPQCIRPDLSSWPDIFKNTPGGAQTSAPSEKYDTNLNWEGLCVKISLFDIKCSETNPSLGFHK